MRFIQAEIPDSLFVLVRERMRRDVTFTPEDIRRHVLQHAQATLRAINELESNWEIIANRVMRSCIDELRRAGEIAQLKHGVWAKTTFLKAASDAEA